MPAETLAPYHQLTQYVGTLLEKWPPVFNPKVIQIGGDLPATQIEVDSQAGTLPLSITKSSLSGSKSAPHFQLLSRVEIEEHQGDLRFTYSDGVRPAREYGWDIPEPENVTSEIIQLLNFGAHEPQDFEHVDLESLPDVQTFFRLFKQFETLSRQVLELIDASVGQNPDSNQNPNISFFPKEEQIKVVIPNSQGFNVLVFFLLDYAQRQIAQVQVLAKRLSGTTSWVHNYEFIETLEQTLNQQVALTLINKELEQDVEIMATAATVLTFQAS